MFSVSLYVEMKELYVWHVLAKMHLEKRIALVELDFIRILHAGWCTINLLFHFTVAYVCFYFSYRTHMYFDMCLSAVFKPRLFVWVRAQINAKSPQAIRSGMRTRLLFANSININKGETNYPDCHVRHSIRILYRYHNEIYSQLIRFISFVYSFFPIKYMYVYIANRHDQPRKRQHSTTLKS